MSPPLEVPLDAWVHELRVLRDSGWAVFDWLGVVEEPEDAPDGGPGGLRLVVQLLRPRGIGDRRNEAGYGRLQVVTRVPAGGSAPSLTGCWPGAAWHEREAWEMFGLAFDGFTDHTGLGLRPLLLDGLGGLDGLGLDDARGARAPGGARPVPPAPPPLRKSVLLPARTQTSWPGAVEPGESPSDAAATTPERAPGGASSRTRRRGRRQRPLGVPASDDGPQGSP